MKPTRESPHSMLGAGVAAVVLALGSATISAYAQDSSAQGAVQRASAGTDTEAATRVKAALRSDPTFDAKHVDVAIDKGDVVLNGFVQSSRALQDATRIATKAAGDRKVVNNLSIKQTYPNAP